MRLERYLSDWVRQIQLNSIAGSNAWERDNTPFMQRLPIIVKESLGIVKGVLLYVVIGIGIGAFMHGYVPEGFLNSICQRQTGLLFLFLFCLQFPCMPMQQE